MFFLPIAGLLPLNDRQYCSTFLRRMQIICTCCVALRKRSPPVRVLLEHLKRQGQILSYPRTEKEQQTNGALQGEGLRLLARIIARIYAQDTKKQSEMGATQAIAKRMAKQRAQIPSKSRDSADSSEGRRRSPSGGNNTYLSGMIKG